MDKFLKDMEALCKEAKKRMERHSTDWQNQQIDDEEMAMIKDRGELERERDDYWDIINYWDIVNFLDTEELLRLLRTEILIYNMEGTDG